MRIIAKSKLRDFYHHHANAMAPLTEWYYKMLNCDAQNINQLRKLFNTADPVGQYTVFNVGGNHFRLIAAIHYNRKCCYIRAIWTHSEYSKKQNQSKLSIGAL